MAVQRIEWQCPGCQRKFAIPSNQPQPTLCPHCQQTAAAMPARKATARATGTQNASLLPTESVKMREPIPAAHPLPGPQVQVSRPVKRRRYAELRTLSMVLKLMACFIGLLTIVLLAEGGRLVMATEAGDLRRYFVYYCFGILIGGSTLALMVYGFSVLLVVALDVEHNTRQD